MKKKYSVLAGIGLVVLTGLALVTVFPAVQTALAQTLGYRMGAAGQGCSMMTNYRGQNTNRWSQPRSGRIYQRGTVTLDRAREIVRGIVARINPKFRVSGGQDAGSYFEFNVKSGGKTVQRYAVDKTTGMVRPI